MVSNVFNDSIISKERRIVTKIGTITQHLPFCVIYIYIYSCKVKLVTIVKGDQKAPFSIATTPRCWGGRYSFHRIAPLYL